MPQYKRNTKVSVLPSLKSPESVANVMHNEAHFYCSSSESRERAECGKPEQTLSQSRCGTIGPDLCPEEMQANKEPEHQNRNMVICFETKIEALL